MTRKRDIERAIEATNPIDQASVGQLPLEGAKRELFSAIVAEPRESPPPNHAADRTRGRRLLPRRSRAGYLVVGAAASTACALVLLITGTLVGPTGSPTPALGAALTRLANASPHILMTIPGWEMEVARQDTATEGAIEFAADDFSHRVFLAGRLKIDSQSVAVLEWSSRPAGPILPPNRYATFVGEIPALGATARVYKDAAEPGLLGPGSRAHDPALNPGPNFTAVWDQAGRRLKLRSTAPDLRTFARRLSSLRLVDRASWLGAVPSELRLVGGNPVAGVPLSDWGVSLSCGKPLPRALAARAKRSIVDFFNRECHLQREPGSRTPTG